jgi:hypothetical protein
MTCLFASPAVLAPQRNALKHFYLPNHPLWLLGHCALTMTRLAARLDGQPLPDLDFVEAARGDETRFGTESICQGSTPLTDVAAFPPLPRAIEIYRAAIARLAKATRTVVEETLHQEIDWHGSSLTLGQLILRVCFHNGCHAGQLVDLRRSLQLPPVITTDSPAPGS